jgi:hypothetical protein
MRTRLMIVGGSLALVGAAFVVQACGDSDPVTSASADAGPDVADDVQAQVDASPPEDEDASPCDTTANFLDSIPDAALADGASTTGICVQCANTKCSKQVEACNQDCPCQGIAADTLDCFLKNPQNPILCAAGFATVPQATQQIGLALIQCINGSCEEECATSAFEPPDGGSDDGG